MVCWIGDVWQAKEDELLEIALETGCNALQWPLLTLKTLFGGLPKSSRRILEREFDKEAALMDAFADKEEDKVPDDGGIEIDSDEAYGE